VPLIGAKVVVTILNDDESVRIWLGCLGDIYNNTTLPNGKNKGNGTNSTAQASEENTMLPTTDMGPLNGDKSRGPYERNVAQSNINQNKGNSSDGYHKKHDDEESLESQVFCWTTPGGHFVTMSDSEDHCRIRIKTTSNQQIILDDTSERIYVSTGKGKTWLELDEDGHIQIYGESKISIGSDKDICISAKDNIHMRAGGNIYMESTGDGRSNSTYGPGNVVIQAKNKITAKSTNSSIEMSAKSGFNMISSNGGAKITTNKNIDIKTTQSCRILTAGSFDVKSSSAINLTSKSSVNVLSSSQINLTASTINLDSTVYSGPIFTQSVTEGSPLNSAIEALSAESATAVWDIDLKNHMIIPTAEPFTRPAHNTSRNENWDKLNITVSSEPDDSDKTSAAHKGMSY
jgi:uncharacterized protein (DUF2345 family)